MKNFKGLRVLKCFYLDGDKFISILRSYYEDYDLEFEWSFEGVRVYKDYDQDVEIPEKEVCEKLSDYFDADIYMYVVDNERYCSNAMLLFFREAV